MKNMVVVVVRDKKADYFGCPYFVGSKDIAVRAFGDAVLSGQSDLSKHPEDFDLFLIGSFDTSTGLITPHELLQIASGLDFVGKKIEEV